MLVVANVKIYLTYLRFMWCKRVYLKGIIVTLYMVNRLTIIMVRHRVLSPVCKSNPLFLDSVFNCNYIKDNLIFADLLPHGKGSALYIKGHFSALAGFDSMRWLAMIFKDTNIHPLVINQCFAWKSKCIFYTCLSLLCHLNMCLKVFRTLHVKHWLKAKHALLD